jgi:hypothetical protein
MADVEPFLANEPVLAVLVNVVKLVAKESLQAPGGPIPFVLNHPLGSNIQHILEDIDMDSEESVGMANDNMGPSIATATTTPRKLLSPIPKAGASSRAPTPKRHRSPTPAGVNGASGSKRPLAFKASKSESSTEIQPEGANWTIGRKLAKLRRDLKGNPFKAVVDLVDHEKFQIKCDKSARGIAEEMLTFQFLVSVLAFRFLSIYNHFPSNVLFFQL